MRAAIAAFLALLFASSLAAVTIEIEPAAPSSATSITIVAKEWVTCPPPPQIARSGNRFTVTIDPGPCLSPPLLARFTFPVGFLTPGDYEVVSGSPVRSGYAAFFVSDANTGVKILGPSVGPTTGGTEVTLLADAVNCFGPDPQVCPMPTVTFNGVVAPVNQEKFRGGSIVVSTPPNARGAAEVVVTGSRSTQRGRVFRYYDRNEGPLPTMFERILMPVWFFGPGAHGSQWGTELTLRNNSDYRFEPFRPLPSNVICPLVACDTTVAGRLTTSLHLGESRAGGVLFLPPRDLSSSLEFGSLVRDTSRQSDDWGTEVPVVRESEFRSGRFNLLNVPIDSRFRTSVRIYGVDSVEGPLTLVIYPMTSNEELAHAAVTLRSPNPCPHLEPCNSDDPAFAMIPDLAAAFPDKLAGVSKVRIEINPQFPVERLWAFSTITNNQTQHVTVITPQ